MILQAVTKGCRLSWLLRVALCALPLLSAGAAAAQPLSFGSSDDPREWTPDEWWNSAYSLNLHAGPSLIGAQWRWAGSLQYEHLTPTVSARLQTTGHAGVYGIYDDDYNEPYDALRALQSLRYTPQTRTPIYVRLGPLERVRLGTGHLVNFLNTDAAWEDRTVGAEFAVAGPVLQVSGFTSNVLPDGLTGGEVSFLPLPYSKSARLRSLRTSVSYVTDIQTWSDSLPKLDAYNLDLSIDALRSGTVSLRPFFSYARYRAFGSGIAFGADIGSPNFVDLARFNLRFALYYNGDAFIPGYLGSFYSVSNTRARIAATEEPGASLVGVSLADAVGGNDVLTELRLLIFERFEFWYSFRRHYGSQELSEYHLRLFLRSADSFNIDVGMDRGGLTDFLSLFSELGSETALVFGTEYFAARPFSVQLRARYTYERVGENDDLRRYIVQRRFEPLVGVRLVF